MDPLKKPVPSGLGRPVKQQNLTHACWLESARQLDQPRTLWNRVKQKTRACSEPPLRVLSDVLLQQVARPSQTTVEKMSKKVGSQRHSQWHPVSKHRESHLQCMQDPPKRNLGERSSTWRKEKWGRRESSAFKKQPKRSSKKREGGG